ncbi:hypothetical protein DRJ17_07545 [Candidatus Woesearchaeota archaeon]|nr:MAG: hypothetical protein DRJ17_07545 [Candidatus Woesearchaeota archaeon]
MIIKKRQIYIIIGLLIVGFLIVNATVDTAKAWHPDNTIKILVDGSEKTLQEAIDENLLNGNHAYSLPSSVLGGEHSADRIWVSVDGVENNLINALSLTGLCGNATTTSYSGPRDKSKAYHYANEIEVAIDGESMSLQEAIDNDVLVKWSEWSECSVSCGGGTQTRTKTCCVGTDCVNYSETRECNTQECTWQLVDEGICLRCDLVSESLGCESCDAGSPTIGESCSPYNQCLLSYESNPRYCDVYGWPVGTRVYQCK